MSEEGHWVWLHLSKESPTLVPKEMVPLESLRYCHLGKSH